VFSNAGKRRTCAFRFWGRNPRGKALYIDKGTGPMRIERRFTKQGNRLREIEFRKALSEIKKSGRLGGVPLGQYRCAGAILAGCRRHPGAEVLPQGRRAARLKKVEENDVPSFLWRSVADEAELASCPRPSATVPRSTPARSRPLAGTWTIGLQGRLLQIGRRRQRFRDELAICWRPARRAELAAMVQHRPALGLWHRWPEPGPLFMSTRSPAS